MRREVVSFVAVNIYYFSFYVFFFSVVWQTCLVLGVLIVRVILVILNATHVLF
jgi:hypothetical protein